MTEPRASDRLELDSVPTAPQASPAVLEGFAGPTTPSVPTPGVSSAVTRIPTAPTLPDDPTHLTGLVARLANELFSAPPSSGASVPSSAVPMSVPALRAPTDGAPAIDASRSHSMAENSAFRHSTPSEARALTPQNPFFSEPSFDALIAGPELGAALLSLPLVESPEPRRTAPEARGSGGQLPSSHATLEPHLGLDVRSGSGFDAHALREEFPILRERVHGKRLVWLDNAATTQKPKTVIDRLVHFYEHENSNIHRAAHALAARATDAYEGARESVRRFVNARSVKEVVFVRGATEGINLVAQSYGRRFLEPGDEIVVTWLEHHANIVPWQMLAKEKGLRLRVAPVDDRGQILLDEFERLLSSKTKLVAMTQVSNALGTVTPAKVMIEMAHRYGAKVLLDGAQSVSHMRVDVQALDPDFFVFSGHKVFAPTGIGAVVAKEAILEHTPPWQGGGNMIQDVTFERTLFQGPPNRFEAGTGNIADAVGLGAALDWLTRVGIENVERHEHDLLVYGTERLCEIPGLAMIGTAAEKAGVLSFILDGYSTHDVSTYLDKQGIAVRGGHHCAQPILRRFGQESTVRASLAPYTTKDDLDALVEALRNLVGGRA